jgi:uncharacterized protein (DUF488 family)
MSLYTIGYEGVNLAQMIDILHARGIQRLVDVREHAFSMKRGFSKTPLKLALENGGIAYEHWRHLGAPRPVREAYKTSKNWDEYCQGYNKHLRIQSEALVDLANLSQNEDVVLLCFEANPLECHRSLIVRELYARRLICQANDLRTTNSEVDVLDIQTRQQRAISS